MNTLLPVPSPDCLKNEHYQAVANYAEKVEQLAFDSAESMEEYYQTVAKKIIHIMAEQREEKRKQEATQSSLILMRGCALQANRKVL